MKERRQAMNWRRALVHLNALDLGVQLLLVVLGVIGLGLWKVFSR
jgi:hypothetical protein